MSYLESLVEEINKIFIHNDNIDLIRGEVITLVQNKSKESFKNGLETARKKASWPKNSPKVK